MRQKLIISALAALMAVGAVQAPAEATGSATRSGSTITVYGGGLHVDSVSVRVRPHRLKDAARLFLVRGGREVREVRGWRTANFRSNTSYTSWPLNESYPAGSRLCSEWRDFGGVRHGWACMILHQ
jgi:hypothetical protein